MGAVCNCQAQSGLGARVSPLHFACTHIQTDAPPRPLALARHGCTLAILHPAESGPVRAGMLWWAGNGGGTWEEPTRTCRGMCLGVCSSNDVAFTSQTSLSARTPLSRSATNELPACSRGPSGPFRRLRGIPRPTPAERASSSHDEPCPVPSAAHSGCPSSRPRASDGVPAPRAPGGPPSLGAGVGAARGCAEAPAATFWPAATWCLLAMRSDGGLFASPSPPRRFRARNGMLFAPSMLARVSALRRTQYYLATASDLCNRTVPQFGAVSSDLGTCAVAGVWRCPVAGVPPSFSGRASAWANGEQRDPGVGRAGRAARAPGAGRGAGGERCPRRGRTHPPGHRKRASPCGLASTSVRREARREARSAAARAGNSWPRTPRIETPVIAQGRWHLHRRRGNKPGCSSGDRGRGECEQARAMQTAPCAHVSFAQRRVKNKAQTQQLESLHADRLVDGVIVALCLPVRAQRLRMDTARCASVCVCVCVCVRARACTAH